MLKSVSGNREEIMERDISPWELLGISLILGRWCGHSENAKDLSRLVGIDRESYPIKRSGRGIILFI